LTRRTQSSERDHAVAAYDRSRFAGSTEETEDTEQDQHGDTETRRPVGPRFARVIEHRIGNTNGIPMQSRLCFRFCARSYTPTKGRRATGLTTVAPCSPCLRVDLVPRPPRTSSRKVQTHPSSPAHCPKTGGRLAAGGHPRSCSPIPRAGTKGQPGGTDGQNQWMKRRFTRYRDGVLTHWPVPCTAIMRFPARRNTVGLRLTHNAEASWRLADDLYETACRPTARHDRCGS
jgi:hypothetical protein